MRVGVLALQGAFEAHARALGRLGVGATLVRVPGELDRLDALVIPGGESGVLLRISRENGLFSAIRAFHERGGAILGTCAGAILVARSVVSPEQESLGLIGVDVTRNAYGRQTDSFEAHADPGPLGDRLPLVFIRAPRLHRVDEPARVLVRHEGEPVAACEGRVLVTAFHPELTDDPSVHSFFIEQVVGAPPVEKMVLNI